VLVCGISEERRQGQVGTLEGGLLGLLGLLLGFTLAMAVTRYDAPHSN